MKHGTLTAYRTHRCRCPECVTVAGRYGKRLRYDAQHGLKRTVDAAAAHARIRELLEYGVSVSAIAEALGYRAPNSVWSLLRRPVIRRSTFDRVMAMPMPDASVTDSRVMSALGARRRLQALAVRGWSLSVISKKTGINVGTLCEIRNGASKTLRQSTHVTIARTYEELEDGEGTCARARTKALRNHWAPPIAWDDIDNPSEKPQGLVRSA